MRRRLDLAEEVTRHEHRPPGLRETADQLPDLDDTGRVKTLVGSSRTNSRVWTTEAMAIPSRLFHFQRVAGRLVVARSRSPDGCPGLRRRGSCDPSEQSIARFWACADRWMNAGSRSRRQLGGRNSVFDRLPQHLPGALGRIDQNPGASESCRLPEPFGPYEPDQPPAGKSRSRWSTAVRSRTLGSPRTRSRSSSLRCSCARPSRVGSGTATL